MYYAHTEWAGQSEMNGISRVWYNRHLTQSTLLWRQEDIQPAAIFCPVCLFGLSIKHPLMLLVIIYLLLY